MPDETPEAAPPTLEEFNRRARDLGMPEVSEEEYAWLVAVDGAWAEDAEGTLP